MVEAALTSPSILPDHRALIGTALNQFQSIEAGMMEVFLGLVKVFEASSSYASASSSELNEVTRRLAQAEQETLRLKRDAEKAEAAKKNLVDARAELERARIKAEQLKASAQEHAKLLAEEQKTHKAAQARITEVEGDLLAIGTERDTLKTAQEKDATELKKIARERQEAVSRANAVKDELQQATEIAAGAFTDLPRSVEEACQHFGASAAPAEQQKAFCCSSKTRRISKSSAQAEASGGAQRAAMLVMEDLCKALWPRDPLPTSFFGLVRRLQGASAQADLWKRSACLEGA